MSMGWKRAICHEGMMPETMPNSRIKPRLTQTLPTRMSFSRSIFPLNNSAASFCRQKARAKAATKHAITINVDSAINFSEISV